MVAERFSHLVRRLTDPEVTQRLADAMPRIGGAESAVLILLADQDDPDVVYTERSATLRHHAGQVSFPGGRREADDPDVVTTALRETREEIGLDPGAVRVLGQLPARGLPVSAFDVVPVVGSWRGDRPVGVMDAAEVAAVHRYPISVLADPANRVTASLPGTGPVGPAWVLGGVFLWGFTGMLTASLLRLGGWSRPWDTSKVVEVPARFRIAESSTVAGTDVEEADA